MTVIAKKAAATSSTTTTKAAAEAATAARAAMLRRRTHSTTVFSKNISPNAPAPQPGKHQGVVCLMRCKPAVRAHSKDPTLWLKKADRNISSKHSASKRAGRLRRGMPAAPVAMVSSGRNVSNRRSSTTRRIQSQQGEDQLPLQQQSPPPQPMPTPPPSAAASPVQKLTAHNSATPDSRQEQPPDGGPQQALSQGGNAEPAPEEAVVVFAEPENEADASSEGEAENFSGEAENLSVSENSQLALANKYVKRIRQQLLRSRFGHPDCRAVEANMHLVRLRRHPTQLLKESQQLEELGVSRSEQLFRAKQIATYLTKTKDRSGKTGKKKGKKKEDEQPQASDFPDWIPFKLRFRRSDAKKLWNDFLLQRREMRKTLGDRAPEIVKAKDKYSESFIDVWTRSLTVQARASSILHDLIRPVFARLGLENRADFRLTIGCFAGDTRVGGAKLKNIPKTGLEVSPRTPVKVLYESGVTEVFISTWPGFRSLFPEGYFDQVAVKAKPKEDDATPADTNASNRNLVLWHLEASQRAAQWHARSAESLADW